MWTSRDLQLVSKTLVAKARHALLGVSLECRPDEDRESPRDQLEFVVGSLKALVCYGRPSARNRPIFGELVPHGELWRTGADEPTVLRLPFRATVAGLKVPRGEYSLYTIPGPASWQIVLNGAIPSSGRTREETGRRGNVFPSAYTDVVRSFEIGRAQVVPETIDHVERLTFRARVVDADTTELLLEWERTRVPIVVRR